MKRYWQKLQESERRTLLLGAAVLLVAAIYLLFSQGLEERDSLQRRRADLLAQEQWWQEQAALLARLDNACAEAPMPQHETEALLRLLAQRAQLDLLRLAVSGNHYSLDLRGEGNDVLRLAQLGMCQGLALEHISVAPLAGAAGETAATDKAGKTWVQAHLELSRDSG